MLLWTASSFLLYFFAFRNLRRRAVGREHPNAAEEEESGGHAERPRVERPGTRYEARVLVVPERYYRRRRGLVNEGPSAGDAERDVMSGSSGHRQQPSIPLTPVASNPP
jgi:hypothetical protein